MANTNDMNAPTKVPCGGFVLGEGLALSKDGKTLNVTGGGGSQADWNQNDETAVDYVKNRPGGYEENSLVPLLPEWTYTNGEEHMSSKALSPAKEDIVFNIKIDDGVAKDYQSIYGYDNSALPYDYWKIGDPTFSEIDFYMIFTINIMNEKHMQFYFKDGRSHKCAVQIYAPIPVSIYNKYLPNSLIQNISDSAMEITHQPDDTRKYQSKYNNKGKYALINGYSCNALSSGGQRSILVGTGLVSEYSRLVIGQYNDKDRIDGNVYAYFVIGNGTSDSKRRNIFAVTEKGEIVVPSSTSGSTKYFKITVDDTGTIKATEVTDN